MSTDTISQLAQKTYRETLPKEKKKSANFTSLNIGIPKEKDENERRITLNPESVGILIKNGHSVKIQSGAGLGAKYSDEMYRKNGAVIVPSEREVFDSDIILKIKPLTDSEIKLTKENQTVFSTLGLPSASANYFSKLAEKKITGLAYEFLEDKGGEFPIVRAMSEIAGSTSILMAAEYLSNSDYGKGIILGGITGVPPAQVVIIGAGTVAEYAAKAALGLGAEVKIFDTQNYRLRRIKYAIGQNVNTSIIEYDTLTKAIAKADVVIGGLKGESGIAPMVVTDEMLSSMEDGGVVIDVAIDQGGCIESSNSTNFKSPIFQKDGIIYCCIPNLASKVPRTASCALSNIFTPILQKCGAVGGIEEMIYSHKWFMNGIYMYKGQLTKLSLARQFNMRFKDLSLLLAAKF